ncbi:MAG: VOC family protein [Firmicutes bacterium]|nr:VOC family protein [Bacillota bacterium]
MKTKLNTSLVFNGNCADALAFYEKVFDVKAEIAGRYKDAPTSDGMPGGFDNPKYANYIMHAEIKFNENQELHFADMPDAPAFNDSFGISLAFDTVEKAKQIFKELSQGGKIVQDIGETFWSKCFGNCKDKFGVDWMISVIE